MNRCRIAVDCASTHPIYSGTTETIQNFTPPRLTMSSVRSLGDIRSSFVMRIPPSAATEDHPRP